MNSQKKLANVRSKKNSMANIEQPLDMQLTSKYSEDIINLGLKVGSSQKTAKAKRIASKSPHSNKSVSKTRKEDKNSNGKGGGFGVTKTLN